jgi:hypothetical protein
MTEQEDARPFRLQRLIAPHPQGRGTMCRYLWEGAGRRGAVLSCGAYVIAMFAASPS